MTKPDDIPQKVWDTAYDSMPPSLQGNFKSSPFAMTLHLAFARALLQARSQAFKEAADLIDEGFDKVVGEPYRDDGKPSKNDKCPHGQYMYEDCESCCSQAIRQHSQKGRDNGND